MRERIAIYLTNLSRYVAGTLCCELVKLPVSADELDAALRRIGIDEFNEEYFISDFESDLSNLHIPEYASISDLNELAEKLDGLADYDYDKLSAVLEMESCTTIAEVLDLIDELDNYELLVDIDNHVDLAEYYLDNGYIFHDVPEILKYYLDFQRLGRDIYLEGNVYYSAHGAVISYR